MKRRFLAVFLLPKLETEHAAIVDCVRAHSEGDFKQIFATANRSEGGALGYVFTSDTPPWQMGFGLLNPDRVLVVELGNQYSETGLNVAGAWLRAHQEK